jgi:hypothetical protein
MIMVLTIFVSEEPPTLVEHVLSEIMLQTGQSVGCPKEISQTHEFGVRLRPAGMKLGQFQVLWRAIFNNRIQKDLLLALHNITHRDDVNGSTVFCRGFISRLRDGSLESEAGRCHK